nr:alpha/beta hydrolase [Deinococcus sp. RIT780]
MLATVLSAVGVPAGAQAARGSAVQASLPPVPGSAAQPADTGRWIKLGGATPSLFQAPATCAVRACPLVVVSHPRGQGPERLRDSPQVQTLAQALLRANFAVLLSSDGGTLSWGSPQGLAEAGAAHAAAIRRFQWSGRTYALGLSMGGLMALRSALPGSPYPVRGVALIDAWTDLELAWDSALSRRLEIEAAYGRATPPSAELNPQQLLTRQSPLPLFVISSLEDTTVKASANSDRLLAHAQPGVSEFLPVTGPHLGANRFTPAVAQRLAGFFTRLETLEWSPPAASGPAAPPPAASGIPSRPVAR